MSDPAGYSGSLMKGASSHQRKAMTDALKAAYERSSKALDAENAGDNAEALRLWRIVVGDEFPAYG